VHIGFEEFSEGGSIRACKLRLNNWCCRLLQMNGRGNNVSLSAVWLWVFDVLCSMHGPDDLVVREEML